MIRATWLAIAAVLAILAFNLPDARGASGCISPERWAFMAGLASAGRASRFRSWSGSTAQAIFDKIAEIANKRPFPVLSLLAVSDDTGALVAPVVSDGVCIKVNMDDESFRNAVEGVVGREG